MKFRACRERRTKDLNVSVHTDSKPSTLRYRFGNFFFFNLTIFFYFFVIYIDNYGYKHIY